MNRTYNDAMFIDTFEHEYTWLNGFMRNVHRSKNKIALIDPVKQTVYTYHTLNAEVNRFANALQKNGIGKNDIVMSVLRNCPEFVFSYIAPRKLGAILLASSFNFAANELAALIDQNKPRVLIYSAIVSQNVEDALKQCAHTPDIVIFADNLEGKSVSESHIAYDDFVKNAPAEEPERTFRPHIYDEVLRLCTSGTTSLSKCVPINDINEVLCAHDVIMQYPLCKDDVCLNLTPWFHRGGCHSGGVCAVFYIGATAIVMRQFLPKVALEWVKKYGITFMTGTPSCLEMLYRTKHRAKNQGQFDLSSLKGIVTMGSPLSREDCIRYMQGLSPRIFNGYGTTETFWNAFLSPSDLPEGAGSVGASCIDDEIRVIRQSSTERVLPDDMVLKDNTELGEIIVKSPAKTTYSYSGNPELAEQRFFQGWTYTGDVGVWDEQGRVTVKGRKDDMIVMSGENIYPSQVEDALKSCKKVKDCIVTGISDALRGEAVVAYVVPADKTLTIKELYDFCTNCADLSQYKKPRYFALIAQEEIPLNSTGKKIRRLLKERAEKDFKAGILQKS